MQTSRKSTAVHRLFKIKKRAAVKMELFCFQNPPHAMPDEYYRQCRIYQCARKLLRKHTLPKFRPFESENMV